MSSDPRSNTTTISPNLPLKGTHRSSRPEVFLGKDVLRIFSKFTGEHPCRSTISIKLQSSFIENTLRHGCLSVNLVHIFRTPFLRIPLNDCFCINYFRKLFHHRCLTESWINLWKSIIGSNETITRNIVKVNFFFLVMNFSTSLTVYVFLFVDLLRLPF